MVILTAWWGLGYSALMVSTVAFGWYLLRRDRTFGLIGLILSLISTMMLWVGLVGRTARGHGWPFVSSADSVAGIALIVLLLYSIWKLFSRELQTGFAVTATALVLFSFALGQQSSPDAASDLFTEPLPSAGILVGTLLKLCGGSLLALAAAISVTPLIAREPAPHTAAEVPGPAYAGTQGWALDSAQAEQVHPEDRDLQLVSEILVRGALLLLAFSLAIDTWWLQKVGLGSVNDAQQAGIALAWMVYFGAVRLRAHPRWRGWPWAAILSIGFLCVLPILVNAPWLENTLPI